MGAYQRKTTRGPQVPTLANHCECGRRKPRGAAVCVDDTPGMLACRSLERAYRHVVRQPAAKPERPSRSRAARLRRMRQRDNEED